MEYFLAELSIHFDNEFSVLSSNLSVSLLTSFSFAFLSALQLLTLSHCLFLLSISLLLLLLSLLLWLRTILLLKLVTFVSLLVPLVNWERHKGLFSLEMWFFFSLNYADWHLAFPNLLWLGAVFRYYFSDLEDAETLTVKYIYLQISVFKFFYFHFPTIFFSSWNFHS